MSELHPDSDLMSLREALAAVRTWLWQPVDRPAPPMNAIEQVVSALEYRLEQETKGEDK